MKTLKNAVYEYLRGLITTLIFSPVIILTLFIIGIMAKLFWMALTFGFNLL